LVIWRELERECRLVVDALLSKVLEDLFQRGLTHAVFSDSVLFFRTFYLTEQVADGLVLLWHSDLVEITALFKKFDLLELFGKEFDESEAILLCVEELDETLQADLLVGIEIFFHGQIGTKTIELDLLTNHVVEVVFIAL